MIMVDVPYRSVIDQSATSEQITKELYKLMTMQTRVFVVHMPPSMASPLQKRKGDWDDKQRIRMDNNR
jgi:hypothetical protein